MNRPGQQKRDQYEECYLPVVEQLWRISGYTAAQLASTADANAGGFERNGLRTLEMAAHMLASNADLIVIQRMKGAG